MATKTSQGGGPLLEWRGRFCQPKVVRGTTFGPDHVWRDSAVKHVQATLSARKDGESSFLQCGSPVKLVQASLCVGSTVQRRFHRREGAARKVQDSLSA